MLVKDATELAEKMGVHLERSRWLGRIHELVADPKTHPEARVILYDLLKLACTPKLDQPHGQDQPPSHGPS
jgi:hypothetical protein